MSSSALYGGTYNQFKVSLPRMGIEARFADGVNVDSMESLIDENTKAIYCETIGNPKLDVPDFDSISKLAKQYELPLIVDNTFGGCGYLCRPIEHGVDILRRRVSGGHGTWCSSAKRENISFLLHLLRVLITSNAKCENNSHPCLFLMYLNRRFALRWRCHRGRGHVQLGMRQVSHVHGAESGISRYGVLGQLRSGRTCETNVAFAIKARVEGLRDLGPCQNPFASFLFLQGLETLSLRFERHCSNALALAKWLRDHPQVAWVNYTGLEEHMNENERKMANQRPGQFGPVLAFGHKGGIEGGKSFIDNVKLSSHLANVGDAKTLVIHPASTTHQLSNEEKEASGVTRFIRVSVGIEHIDDIIADFDQALNV